MIYDQREERHRITTAPDNGKPIISGHTPDELTRWKDCRAWAIQMVNKAELLIEWAEHEIERIESEQ